MTHFTRADFDTMGYYAFHAVVVFGLGSDLLQDPVTVKFKFSKKSKKIMKSSPTI